MPSVIHLRRGRGVRRVQGVMNGLERAYSELLNGRKLAGEVLDWKFDAVKLRLADKTFYEPDFFVLMADGTIEIHEVKGFMREDAAVKIKTAAWQWPFVFRLCRRKRKSDPWEITEVGHTEPIVKEDTSETTTDSGA